MPYVNHGDLLIHYELEGAITNTCGERRDAGTRLPVQFVSSPGGSTSRLELEIASESPTTWPKAA